MSHENVNEFESGADAVAFNDSIVSTGIIDGGVNVINGFAGIILTVRYCVHVFPWPYEKDAMTVLSS